MELEVIGAGFGRTATLSLKAALEQLGFGPCYHQYELVEHPEHAASWAAANAGDIDALGVPLREYRSTVDWPGCSFWRELSEMFPNAQVVLSVRPPERWYASFRDTVGAVLVLNRTREVSAVFAPVLEMNDQVIRERCFGPDYDVNDKERVIAAYEAHNAAVRAGIAPERLLEFDVADGWRPLCTFLDVPAPTDKFPNINDREQFKQLMGLNDGVRPSEEPADVDAIQSRFRGAMDPGTNP
jgi:hypothetical protein